MGRSTQLVGCYYYSALGHAGEGGCAFPRKPPGRTAGRLWRAIRIANGVPARELGAGGTCTFLER